MEAHSFGELLGDDNKNGPIIFLDSFNVFQSLLNLVLKPVVDNFHAQFCFVLRVTSFMNAM